MSRATENSLAEISGRFGVLAMLMTRCGGPSLARFCFSRSIRFLALRRLARSGTAVMTISSAWNSTRFTHGRPGVRQVDGHERHVLAHHLEHEVAGVGRDLVVAVEHDRGGEDAQMLGALGEQAVEQHLIEPLGALQRLGDALHRVLVEVEAGGAEGQVEVGDDDVGLEDLRHRPGGVVAHRAGADAALGADEGDDVADGIGIGIVVEVREALDQLQRPRSARSGTRSRRASAARDRARRRWCGRSRPPWCRRRSTAPACRARPASARAAGWSR